MPSRILLIIPTLLFLLGTARPAGAEGDMAELLGREPLTATVLAVMKDGRPLVLADMLPEWPKLKALAPAEREDYLLRRALILAGQKKEAKKDFAEQPVFAVRFILLTETDEYSKPKWGTAPELALLEAERAAFENLTLEDIAALDAKAVKARFKAVKIDQDALGKIPG